MARTNFQRHPSLTSLVSSRAKAKYCHEIEMEKGLTTTVKRVARPGTIINAPDPGGDDDKVEARRRWRIAD
jgi:hypothetical protein